MTHATEALSGDDTRDSDSDDRVLWHLFRTALTLARVLRLQPVDDPVAVDLELALAELDAAVVELRDAAFTRVVGDRAPMSRSGRVKAITTRDPVAQIRAVADLRRHLRRCDNDEVFAYAMHGHSFVRASDHSLWAHERDDLLLSARSGTPLARRSGVVFYDLESNKPLYYESHGQDPRPGPTSLTERSRVSIAELPASVAMTDATTAAEGDGVATATRRVITSIDEFVDGVATGHTTPMVLQPGPIRAEVVTIDLTDMTLVVADYSFAVASHGESLPDRVALLGSPHRRVPSSHVNGVSGAPGVAHAFGSSAEVATACAEPLQFFVASIAPERLERTAQTLGVEIDLPGPGEFYPVRMAGRARLRRLLLDVTQSVRDTGMPAANMQATVAITDTLAEIGVRCFTLDNDSNALRSHARLNSVHIVRTCEEYAARSHYQRVTLAELCRASGVSERRIRHAFYDCYGMSPTAHLRIAALNEVRRALLGESPMRDAVSRAASDFGFWHLSRFAGQYRALFGESPSETHAHRSKIAVG